MSEPHTAAPNSHTATSNSRSAGSTPQVVQPDAPRSGRVRRAAASALPSDVLHRFGGPRARPRILQVYDARTGWSADMKHTLLTVELLRELHAAGVSLIDARWRSSRHQINLATLDLTVQ